MKNYTVRLLIDVPIGIGDSFTEPRREATDAVLREFKKYQTEKRFNFKIRHAYTLREKK